MPQVTLPCPHCNAEKIGFTARQSSPLKPGSDKTVLFLQCEGCGEGVVALVNSPPTIVNHWMGGHAPSPGPFSKTYPEAKTLAAPADVPNNVRAAFLSGLDNLRRPNGANAAAIMFRRTVELAVKNIAQGGTGDLRTRIDALPPEVATPAMKEWAHHIRLEGNDAVHDTTDYSDEDAKQLHLFAELFLTYAYTLPEMLKRAKETH